MSDLINEPADFVITSQKRVVENIHILPRQQVSAITNGLCELDMRINKIELNQENIATIVLVFRLDYFPTGKEEVYVICSKYESLVTDRNRLFDSNPAGDLAVVLIADFYKENGEILFKELEEKSRALGNPITGDFTISDSESMTQSRIILERFFRRKT